jgi:hypothetical protein
VIILIKIIPENCVAKKKLDVIAPKNLKNPFIHILTKNNAIKKVKNRSADKLRPIIKYAQISNSKTKIDKNNI